MQQNEALRYKTDAFEEFMDVTFRLSEEELQAIHGLIPMTQELFDRCMRKCEEIGAVGQMEALIADFPEQCRAYRAADGVYGGTTAVCGKAAGVAEAEGLRADALWQRIHAQLERNEACGL